MTTIPTYPNFQSIDAVEERICPPVLPLTTLRIILFIYSPVAAVEGTPSIWFAQPISQTKVPMAGAIIILLDFITMFVSIITRRRIFSPPPGLETLPSSVTMNLSDLSALLANFKKKSNETNKGNQGASPTQTPVPGQRQIPTQMPAPESLTLYLFVTGFFGPTADSPRSSFYIPILNVRGITGGLPILIMGLIATILLRQVVPPEASGIQPPPTPTDDPKFEFSLQEILHLLRRFGASFNNSFPWPRNL